MLIILWAIFFALFFWKSLISADYSQLDTGTQQTLSWLTNWLLSYRPLDTNTYDYSTYINNGIASGATQTWGKLDGAYLFRGSGRTDSIIIPNSTSLNPTTGLSIQAWVKWKSNPSSGLNWANILNKNGNGQYRLQHSQYNSAFEFAIQTTKNAYVQSTTHPQINIWYHVIGTYDGALLKIYVNGVLENTLATTWSIQTSTSQLTIGKMNSERYFDGNIDEVALWNRALSTKEIQTLYNSGYGNRVLLKNYTLSYTATSNWSISGNSFQQINLNGNGTSVSAIPDPWYHFVQRSDGSTQNPRTDTNIIWDISVSAMFYADPPLLAVWLLWYRPLDADTHDYSTNINDGIANGATQTWGKVSGAYTFNGQSDYINVPDSTSLNPVSGLTIQAWVKWKSIPSSSLNRSSLVNKDGDGQYRLQHKQDNSAFEFAVSTSKTSYRVRSTTQPQINTWYHVVGTYDGILLRIYINGTLENTLPASWPLITSTSPLSIGKRSNLNDRYFNGNIDEVAIWNRPLSSQEIQVLYNSGNGNRILSNAYTLLYTSMPNWTITGTFFQQVNKGGNGSAVTAIPNQWYHFVQWNDGSTQNPRIDTNVNWNISVYPLFNKTDTTHSLMYNAWANGWILGDANQIIISGTNGTQVTAIPNNWYRFLQWSDGSTDDPRTDINVRTDISVTAQFSQIITKHSVIYIAWSNGSISGDTSQEVQSWSNGTMVTAIPNSWYHFVQRSDGSIQNPRIDTNIIWDIVVSIQFNKNVPVYTLTYTALPNGMLSGSISQTVSGGMNGTTILANANPWYHFVQRSDGSTQNPRIDYNVIWNISVYALFNETNTTHSLMYDAWIYWSIYGSTQQLILSGQNGTLINVFPNPWYHFVQRSDGSTQNPRIDTNVIWDISVIAQYAKDLQTFTLSYSHDNYGGIYGSDYQNIVSWADGATVTALPNPWYHFVQRSDGSTQNPRTDTHIIHNITVSTQFSIDAFDTIYLPNVTSKSAMDTALIASWYNSTWLSSIRTELTGFLVWNKKISTRDSNGKILSALIIQSPSPTNKIEVQIPAGTIVKNANNNSYTWVLIVPETISNISVPLQNVIYATNLWSTGWSIQFKDQNNNPVYVTIRMPAPWNISGDVVSVYYSTDNWSTWNLYKNTKVVMIWWNPYVEFTTNHFTDFAVTLPAWWGSVIWSFVINNDTISTSSSGVTLNISTTPSANQMRFSNDNLTRSNREPYVTSRWWTLSWIYWTKTIYAEFDIGSDGISDITTNDTINYIAWGPAWGGWNDLTLRILTGHSYCQYGTTLDFWTTGLSYTGRSLITWFVATGGNPAWFCEDQQWVDTRALTIQSSPLVNISTNISAQTIPASRVYIKNPAAYISQGACTFSSGVSLDQRVNLSGAKAILGKAGMVGEWCKIITDTVSLRVDLIWAQAIGQYSGTLTINVPNF